MFHEHPKKRIITILFLFIISITNALNAAQADSSSREKKFKSIIQFMSGYSFVAQSSSFRNDYHRYLGGLNDDYKMSPSFTFYYKLDLFETFRPCITYDYSVCDFTDYYSQRFMLLNKPYERYINELMNIKTSTFLLGLEFLSKIAPYRSSAGISFGLAYSITNWNETVNSTMEFDKRKSGSAYSEKNYSPSIRIHTGLNLDFDHYSQEQFLGAIHFEAAIMYIYRNIPIFKNIRSQIPSAPEYWNSNLIFLPFYMNLNLGISFNLYHTLKKV